MHIPANKTFALPRNRVKLLEREKHQVILSTIPLLGGGYTVVAFVRCHGKHYAYFDFSLALGSIKTNRELDAAFCKGVAEYMGGMDEYKIAEELLRQDADWGEDLRELMCYAGECMDALKAVAGICEPAK